MTESKMPSLSIDEANLSKELAEHSANYCYVGEQAIHADLAYGEFKLKVSELAAMVDRDIRMKAEADGKKITEAVVANGILMNEEMKKANRHLLKLKANADLLRVHKDAFKDRGGMLIQMSSNKRAEMEAFAYDSVKSAAV